MRATAAQRKSRPDTKHKVLRQTCSPRQSQASPCAASFLEKAHQEGNSPGPSKRIVNSIPPRVVSTSAFP